MSLDWEIGKCHNWKELVGDNEQGRVTETLVWATMPAGFNRITEKNLVEVYTRIYMLERVRGAYLLRSDGTPRYITMDDIKRRIGLFTNADNMTTTQFLKRLHRLQHDDVRREFVAVDKQ